MACDVNGTKLGKGDVVMPLAGGYKGRVCDLKTEEGMGFVCIRAAHQPYSKGVWYASDQVQRLSAAKIKPAPGSAPAAKTFAKR